MCINQDNILVSGNSARIQQQISFRFAAGFLNLPTQNDTEAEVRNGRH